MAKRTKKSAWITEEHDILGGKAVVLRVAASGDVYQFRMWISEEGKYIRKSLKTRDLETAKKRAEEIVFQTMSDVASGRKMFGITLGELVQEYLEWRLEDVEIGNITAGRLVTLKSQMKHLLAYKNASLKLAELGRESLYDYGNWRKKTHPGVREVTIKNEISTLNHLMGMAYRKGYAHFDTFDFRKVKIRDDAVNRRDTFSLDEYDDLVRYMRTYTSKKECEDEAERQERLLIRDCVLIASNTMMRVGELWNLKWGVSTAEQNPAIGRRKSWPLC